MFVVCRGYWKSKIFFVVPLSPSNITTRKQLTYDEIVHRTRLSEIWFSMEVNPFWFPLESIRNSPQIPDGSHFFVSLGTPSGICPSGTQHRFLTEVNFFVSLNNLSGVPQGFLTNCGLGSRKMKKIIKNILLRHIIIIIHYQKHFKII